MDITLHASFLGPEVRDDVAHDGLHWITVGPADQPGGLPVRLQPQE